MRRGGAAQGGRFRIRARPVAAFGVLAALVAPGGCGRGHQSELERLCPQLPHELTRALAANDEQALRRFSVEQGRDRLAGIFTALSSGRAPESRDEFARYRVVVAPALQQLGERLAQDHLSPQERHYARYLASLSGDDEFEVSCLRRERDRVSADSTLTESQQTLQMESVLGRLAALGDTLDCIFLLDRVVAIYQHQRQPEVALSRLRRALELARAFGSPVMVSQLAGTLGLHYADGGDFPRMWESWSEAKEVARRHRLGAALARITSWEAMYYEDRGQLALAADLYQAAEQECHELGGGPAELRFAVAFMRFASQLGAWDLIQRELPRARALRDQWEKDVFVVESRAWARTLRQLEARYYMSQGRVGDAEELYRRDIAALQGGYDYHLRCGVLLDWSRGLMDNGRPRQALPLAGDAVRLLEAHHLIEYVEAFLVQARAQLQLGLLEEARRSLRGFDSITAAGPAAPLFEGRPFAFAIQRSVLGIEILAATGDRGAAIDSLSRSVASLSRAARSLSADEHAALSLGEAEGLHRLLHRFVGDDPQRSYRLECAWKQLLALHGSGGSSWADGNRRRAVETIQEQLTQAASEPVAHAPGSPAATLPDGVEHWIYCVRGNGVVRWVASVRGVTRDSLEVTPARLQRQVQQALRAVHEGAGPQLSGGARRALAELARTLIPRGPDGRPWVASRRVLVTPAQGLLALPFELLDLTGPGSAYEPLLERADLAYLRFDAVHAGPPGQRSGALVVADPQLSAAQLRQHSGLGQLPRARREGERAAALMEPATVLTGAQATKQNLLRHWEGVRTLYYAGHVVRDPNLPFCSFLPLAPDGADVTSGAGAYLGMADVVTADLSGCELVVLSACGGAAAYVTAQSAAPGLGEAFLDAGARAVISSFWDVRDEDAEQLMAMFLERWRGGATDPVAALCAARRVALRGGGPLADPRVWASVAIGVGGTK